MITTRGRRQLINDAMARGYRVIETESDCLIRTGATHRSVGIMLWPNGTATRADMDLTVTKSIRTIKEMRQLLHL